MKTNLELKLQELIVKVHHRLLDNDLQKVSRVWLLLAVEIYARDFGILPEPIYKFFTEQLGPEAMKDFQVRPIKNVRRCLCIDCVDRWHAFTF